MLPFLEGEATCESEKGFNCKPVVWRCSCLCFHTDKNPLIPSDPSVRWFTWRHFLSKLSSAFASAKTPDRHTWDWKHCCGSNHARVSIHFIPLIWDWAAVQATMLRLSSPWPLRPVPLRGFAGVPGQWKDVVSPTCPRSSWGFCLVGHVCNTFPGKHPARCQSHLSWEEFSCVLKS